MHLPRQEISAEHHNGDDCRSHMSSTVAVAFSIILRHNFYHILGIYCTEILYETIKKNTHRTLKINQTYAGTTFEIIVLNRYKCFREKLVQSNSNFVIYQNRQDGCTHNPSHLRRLDDYPSRASAIKINKWPTSDVCFGIHSAGTWHVSH